MFCMNCGKVLPDGAKFCMYCGTPLGAAPAPAPVGFCLPGRKYLACDLLILDDLGTELGGAFTTACLYDIINTRLVRGLPTVMSTNLSPKELTDRYGERIASRLFGEYTPLVFCGEDVRKEKMGMQ